MKGTVAERMMHKMATKCQMAMTGCVSAAKGAVAPFDGKFTPDDVKHTNVPVKVGAKAPMKGTFCPNHGGTASSDPGDDAAADRFTACMAKGAPRGYPAHEPKRMAADVQKAVEGLVFQAKERCDDDDDCIILYTARTYAITAHTHTHTHEHVVL